MKPETTVDSPALPGGRENGDGVYSATLKKGLSIISLFDVERPEWTFTDICRQTKLPKATAFRLIKTLESLKYLAYDPQASTYHLGSSMLRAAFLTLSVSELARIAHPYLEELANVTTETVVLTVWTDQGPMIADTVLTSRPFKPHNPVGMIMPGLANVHSRIYLALASDAERDLALSKPVVARTEFTRTDPGELASELVRIRNEGLAFGLQEWNLGMCAVAAPLFDSSGSVRATIAVITPSERFGPSETANYGAAVTRTAGTLSGKLDR